MVDRAAVADAKRRVGDKGLRKSEAEFVGRGDEGKIHAFLREHFVNFQAEKACARRHIQFNRVKPHAAAGGKNSANVIDKLSIRAQRHPRLGQRPGERDFGQYAVGQQRRDLKGHAVQDAKGKGMLGGNLKAKLEERSAIGRAHFVARLHVGNRPRRPIFSILAATRLEPGCSLVRGEYDRRSVLIGRAVHFEEAAEFVKNKVVCWIVVRAGARLEDELHRRGWVFDDAARTRLSVAGEVPSNPAEAHRLAKGLDLRQVAGHLGIATPKSLYLGEDAQRRDAAELKAQKARKAQGRPQRDNALVVGKGAADELVERVVAG